MNESTPQQRNLPNKEQNPFLGLTILIGIVAVIAWLFLKIVSPPQPQMIPLGTVAPVIEAEGWLNGSAPTPEQLQGKVIFVEAWATWCAPCRMHAPELVKDYVQFKDNPEVVFIGLTSEDASALPQIESFLKTVGITWLNGYGASKTLNDFKAEYIPSEWVIDRQGNIVWRTGDAGTSVEAIENALAKK